MSYSRRELYALGEPLGDSVTIKKVGGGYVCGGGGSGGGGSSQTTQTGTTTSYQTNIPEYLQGPTQNMVARGELLSNQPYIPYSGARVAGLTPAQQNVYSQLGAMGTPSQFGQAGATLTGAEQFGAAGALGAMGYQPTQFNAYQMAGPGNITGTGYDAYGVQAAPDVQAQQLEYFQMQQPGTFGAEQAQQYMSPYQQAVTDIAKREALNESALLNRQLAGQAAKAGAFGGSRFGVEQALLGKSLATNLSDIQTKGLESAYANAQQQYERDRAAQMSAAGQNLQAALGVQSLGAGQNLQAQLANQSTRQQANLASQAAYNQALQFGATQEQAAAIANQQMQYNVGQQNLQSALTTQQQQDAARQAAANLNLQGAQFGAQTGLTAAQQRQGLGTAQQTADLQRLAAQESAGKAQQDQQQAELNAAYNTFLEQRDWEKNQLGFLSGLIRGTPFSTSQTGTTTAPAPSTTSQLAGLGIAGVGLANLLK